MRGVLASLFLGLVLACSAQAKSEITGAHAQLTEEGVLVSAQVQFELSPAVEDALLKGVAVVFVVRADVMRARWYWYDKRITSDARYMRLAFQPLMRRWKLNISSSNSSTGLTLNQSFDTLEQALDAIRRISHWKVADLNEVDPSAKNRVELSFNIDLSQLPRPFQIGTIGQADWDIGTNVVLPLEEPEPGK